MPAELQDFSWNRMIEAVQAVHERACRATAALNGSRIPYAIAGGHAVAFWVATIDQAAVRNTPDVEILIRRTDRAAAKASLEPVGLRHQPTDGVDYFIDGPDGSLHSAVILRFESETVTADSVAAQHYQILSLEALVCVSLNSFRRVDRVYLRDLLDIGLIDRSWLPRLSPEHATRLQELIDDPDG